MTSFGCFQDSAQCMCMEECPSPPEAMHANSAAMNTQLWLKFMGEVRSCEGQV